MKLAEPSHGSEAGSHYCHSIPAPDPLHSIMACSCWRRNTVKIELSIIKEYQCQDVFPF